MELPCLPVKRVATHQGKRTLKKKLGLEPDGHEGCQSGCRAQAQEAGQCECVAAPPAHLPTQQRYMAKRPGSGYTSGIPSPSPYTYRYS